MRWNQIARLYLNVHFDEDVTDAESIASAMDTLMETAKSTPGILDDYGNPEISSFSLTPTSTINQQVLASLKELQDWMLEHAGAKETREMLIRSFNAIEAAEKEPNAGEKIMAGVLEDAGLTKPKIHIACISHDHGNGFFTADTEEKLYERLALEFVSLYVGELPEEARQDVVRELEAKNYRHAVHIYFEYNESESLEVGTGD